MKLDYDCVRHILLTIEGLNTNQIYIDDIADDDYSLSTISYHTRLLLDEGFVIAQPISIARTDFEQFIIERMTMKGHEYLNTIRSNAVWNDTKNELKKISGSTSLEIIKSVATKIALKFLGL